MITEAERNVWKKIGKNSHERRRRNTAMVNETLRLLGEEGATEESVFPVICDRFDVTENRLRSVMARAAGFDSPTSQKEIEAKVLVYLDRLSDAVQYSIQDSLDSLHRLEDTEDEFVAVEVTDTSNSKDNKTVTKRMNKDKVRTDIHNQIMNTLERIPKALATLKGTTINVHTGMDDMTMQDISHRIKVLETEHNIEDGVSEDSGR